MRFCQESIACSPDYIAEEILKNEDVNYWHFTHDALERRFATDISMSELKRFQVFLLEARRALLLAWAAGFSADLDPRAPLDSEARLREMRMQYRFFNMFPHDAMHIGSQLIRGDQRLPAVFIGPKASDESKASYQRLTAANFSKMSSNAACADLLEEEEWTCLLPASSIGPSDRVNSFWRYVLHSREHLVQGVKRKRLYAVHDLPFYDQLRGAVLREGGWDFEREIEVYRWINMSYSWATTKASWGMPSRNDVAVLKDEFQTQAVRWMEKSPSESFLQLAYAMKDSLLREGARSRIVFETLMNAIEEHRFLSEETDWVWRR